AHRGKPSRARLRQARRALQARAGPAGSPARLGSRLALTGQRPDSVQVRMLARPAVRSVLTRSFTRRIPPLLVWLKVADAGACDQRRRPLSDTSEVTASEAGR